MENRNMWGSFTAEDTNPFLEFDFIASTDASDLCCKSKTDFEAMGKGDRLDLVTKLSRRLELQRIKVCVFAINVFVVQ